MHAASSDTPPVLTALLGALERGATVVTPNKRTSGWLRGAHDEAQQARGRRAWATPQILPWNVWSRTLWQRLRATDRPPREQLLTPWQERRIWASVIASDRRGALLHAGNAVDLALAAWETAQEWGGPWAQWGGDDARDEQRAFVAWASAFVKRCADHGWIDGARLPALIVDALRTGALAAAEPLVLYGFAELGPSRERLLEALTARGTSVERIATSAGGEGDDATAAHVRCIDPDDEYRRCAQWCRELLARDAGARIGVVIPDLARRKPQVERLFAAMLAPQSTLDGRGPVAAFNLSQGEPLASRALAATALTILEWTQHSIPHSQLAALLRSPYVAGHADETAMRACLCRDAI
jgi:hypothetical protein